MAESKKLAILKALTAHLQGITLANGYDFDLSTSVFRGRGVFGSNDPVPMISILEFPTQEPGKPAAEEGIQRKEAWMLLLQGTVEDDNENPLDPAYGLLAATEQRLSDIIRVNGRGDPDDPVNYMLGKRVVGLTIGPGVCRPPDGQVSAKAYFFLPLRVGIAVDASKPFV